MSTTTGLWAHLPGTHHGHFEVVVDLSSGPRRYPDPPPPARRRRRRPGIVLPLLVVLAGVVLTLVALRPDPAEAQAGTTTRLTDTAQVATGERHGCARSTTGRARCWGDGTTGALGNGTTSRLDHAVLVRNAAGTGPLTGVRQVAAGDEHSCALLTGGGVACWGANENGQLGNGSVQGTTLPVRVKGVGGSGQLTGVASISAGGDNTCAVLQDGGVACWGEDEQGQVGAGVTSPHRDRPHRVGQGDGPYLGDVTQVEVGGNSSCARRSNGRAFCWGRNIEGQLGNGTVNSQPRAVVVRSGPDGPPLTGVGSVSVGFDHACARLGTGELRCWGSNQQGRLGDGSATTRLYPTPVLATAGTRLTGVQAVRAGNGATCALLAGGGVRCWGWGTYGTMGNGARDAANLLPVAVRNGNGSADLRSATQLALGELTACVRLADGQARCWGYGDHGATGNGPDLYDEAVPLPVPVLQGPLQP